MWFVLALIVIGISAGWIAEKVVYPEWKIDWTEAFVVGLIGSFLGGVVVNLIAGEGFSLHPAGVIGSIIGAIVVLAILKWIRGRIMAAGERS